MSTDRFGEWPILLEATETRLAWISAESHEEALRSAQGDYELFQHAEPTDSGGISASLPEEWDEDMVRASIGVQGPAPLCMVCQSYVWGGPDLHHDFECPVYRAGLTRYASRVLPRAQEIADLLGLLLAGHDANVEVDGSRVRVQVRPESVAQWQAWLRLAGVDPKKVSVLATYAHGWGRVGVELASSVDVILVGLGVPQLPAAAESVTA